MSALFDLSSNYSIFTIPAAWLLAMWPSTYGKVKGRKILDPANPRDFVESIKKSDQIDKTIRNRLIRSQAAALNGFEGLPMFIGAVLAANIAGLPAKTVNLLAASYLFSRIVYNATNFTSRGASIGCVEPITGTRGAYSTLPAKSTDYGTNAPPPVALTNTLTNCRVKCRRLQNADSRVVNLHVPAMGTEGRHVHFLYPFDYGLDLLMRIYVGFTLTASTWITVLLSILLGCQPLEKNWQIYPDPGSMCPYRKLLHGHHD
ncbi:uncharacterized protein PG998_014570 [Apiospora kogelbergensis]|uniref:uncharacterized protein n=1 Tax=Apiospora kogelbergensis TaxID=1337665 RepID=UPI00312E32DA